MIVSHVGCPTCVSLFYDPTVSMGTSVALRPTTTGHILYSNHWPCFQQFQASKIFLQFEDNCIRKEWRKINQTILTRVWFHDYFNYLSRSSDNCFGRPTYGTAKKIYQLHFHRFLKQADFRKAYQKQLGGLKSVLSLNFSHNALISRHQLEKCQEFKEQ